MSEEYAMRCESCGEAMLDDRDGMTGARWFCANGHRAILIHEREPVPTSDSGSVGAEGEPTKLDKARGQLQRHRDHLDDWGTRKHWTKVHLLECIRAAVHDVKAIQRLLDASPPAASEGVKDDG